MSEQQQQTNSLCCVCVVGGAEGGGERTDGHVHGAEIGLLGEDVDELFVPFVDEPQVRGRELRAAPVVLAVVRDEGDLVVLLADELEDLHDARHHGVLVRVQVRPVLEHSAEDPLGLPTQDLALHGRQLQPRETQLRGRERKGKGEKEKGREKGKLSTPRKEDRGGGGGGGRGEGRRGVHLKAFGNVGAADALVLGGDELLGEKAGLVLLLDLLQHILRRHLCLLSSWALLISLVLNVAHTTNDHDQRPGRGFVRM